MTRLFNNGWECDCSIIPTHETNTETFHDSPSMHSDLSDTHSPPHEEPTSYRRQSRQSRQSHKAQTEYQSDIKDATINKKYLINDDFELVSANGAHTIRIHTRRPPDALPSKLENGQFITKINDTDIRVGSLTEFHQLLEYNKFYDKPVVLTVAMGSAGGYGDQQFKVQVNLKREKIPREFSVGGGKKTRYVTCKCTKEIKIKKQPKTGVSMGVSKGVSKGEGEGEGVSEGDDSGVAM